MIFYNNQAIRIAFSLYLFFVSVPVFSVGEPNSEYVVVLPVNINTANATILSRALVGVGPVKAQNIVQYRKEHGDFQEVGDLEAVKGIGSGTLSKNQGRIRTK